MPHLGSTRIMDLPSKLLKKELNTLTGERDDVNSIITAFEEACRTETRIEIGQILAEIAELATKSGAENGDLAIPSERKPSMPSVSDAREALNKTLDEEGKARKCLGMTAMMDFPGDLLRNDRKAVQDAIDATKSAIEAFGSACRAETRTSIAVWIEGILTRMKVQPEEGSPTTGLGWSHHLFESGKRNATALILEGIQRLADLEEQK